MYVWEDYRKRVIREKTEAFHKDCLKRTVKFPQGIMVWGCISAKGLGTLHFIKGTVNAAKYQDVLEHSLLPSAAKLHPSGDFIFQQDGASCHTAKSTKKWMGEHDIKVIINKFCHIPLAARILIHRDTLAQNETTTKK